MIRKDKTQLYIFYHAIVVKTVMLLGIFVETISLGFSQDPQFSQFYAASMYLNPAFTGNTIQHRLTGIYRNQWQSVGKAFVSSSFSYDQNLTDLNSGIGIVFTQDKAGTGGLRYTNIAGMYAYYFQINKKLMARFGTKFSYTFRNYDLSKLRFNDQIITGSPATIESLEQGVSYPDFGSGGLMYSEKFWVGIAFDHLNQPNQSFIYENTPLPIKSSLHGGYKFIIDDGDVQEEHGKSVTIAANYKAQEKWDIYLKTSNFNLIYPFENFVVMSEKPTNIKFKKDVLHNEKGASVCYADGFEIYSLNGVRVTKEIVMTPAEKLDVNKIIKEPNVEVRRELIRKIGIERFIVKIGAVTLDKKDNYELLKVSLPEIDNAIYLKMKNPSIGVFHVEGVDPSCKTVEQALNWRAYGDINKNWKPYILT